MLLAVFSAQLRIDWSLSDLEKSCGMGDVKGMRELARVGMGCLWKDMETHVEEGGNGRGFI